jgi:hypothetical protein
MSFCIEEGHEYTAPLWLGEFGAFDNKSLYWQYLMRYLKENS